MKNESERYLYELREKGRHDFDSAMITAEKRGTAKRNLEIARSMLAKDMSLDLTAEITGLSVEELKSKPKRIKYYRTADGKIPFLHWFDSLRNLTAKDEIRSRLNRVRLGNYGDCKSVRDGVLELRFRSGIRIYFTEIGDIVVLLFCGGDKETQDRDVTKAKLYWKDFKLQSKAGGK